MNTSSIAGIVLLAIVIFALVIAIFHFWVFPNLIEVTRGIEWINVTDSFINALYWFIVGIIVLVSIKSTKITFKE